MKPTLMLLQPDRARWLLAIGILKLFKAALFLAMGFGVIKLLHKDVGDILLHVTMALRFDPESRAVNILLDRAATLDPHRLKEISFGLFLYAGLDIIEGTGLVLKKGWAEYFTLILTCSFLPWELYEILRHVTGFKVVLFLLNFIVAVYLAVVVKDRMHGRQHAAEASANT